MKPRPDFLMMKLEADADRIATLTVPLLDMLDAACEAGGICPVHARFELALMVCGDLGAAGWPPGEVAEHAAAAARCGAEEVQDDGADDGDEDDDEAMI